MAKIRHQENHSCIEYREGHLTLRGFYKTQKKRRPMKHAKPKVKK
jgi:hypothetical protein